jgi:hypothetical protein
MAKAPSDDFEAVRTVVATLEPFEPKDQERILRWAREKLGLSVAPANTPAVGTGNEERAESTTGEGAMPASAGKATDIRTFIANKKPQSDNQFAAAVAYYYRFETPEPQRKDAIGTADLQEACRLTDRERIKHPAQTLVNAHNQGYLDKGAQRGTYTINTVGENLVAMALPEGAAAKTAANASRRRGRPRGKSGKKRRR